jgi:hypothetical protein
MAIKLTQEDAAVLSQMAYMNIAKENDFNDRFKGASLQKMAADLLADRKKAIAEGKNEPTFDQWGSFTDREQYEMLEKIAAGDYPDLSNLKVKDYKNDEGKDNFVGYAFSGENPQDVVCAFRGTMGSKVGDPSNFLGESWLNNYNLGVNGGSLQFKPTKDFVEKNMTPGAQTIVTGHSQGGGDGLYACATIPGVTGVVFDAPGIGQDLTSEQSDRLANSGSTNIVNQNCPVGAVLFHPEKRIYAQYFDHNELDKYGRQILDENGLPKNISGPFAGHYLQTIHSDKDGNVIEGERSLQSKLVEGITQAAYNNVVLRTTLGLAVSTIQLAKGDLSDVENIHLQQLQLLGEDIKSLGSQISNAGANIVQGAETAITNTANQVYQDGVNAVNSAETAIANTANQAYQAGANAVNSAETAIANTANQVYQDGVNAVNSAEAAITNTANQVYQDGVNAVNSAEAAITNTANQVYQDGVNAVNSAEAAIGNAAQSAETAIRNAFSSNDTASSQAPAEDNSNTQQAVAPPPAAPEPAAQSSEQPPAEPAQDTSASQTPSLWDSAVQSLQSWVAGTNESQEQTQGQRI